MVPGEIVCAHCGWRNEATARMCGGCGQPLRMTGAPAGAALTQAVPIRAAPAQTSGMPLPPTAPAPAGVYPATHIAPQTPYAAPYAAAPAWPGPGQPPGGVAAQPAAQRSRWRIPMVLLVTLCVLLAATLGAWALVIRPAVHATVDGQLQSALDTAIEQAAPAAADIPPGTRLSITIPAADVNADINNELGDVPVKNVRVLFRDGGYINTSYSLLGSDGAIVTQLVPLANGRVEAVNTDVTGPLALVESNDEMTRTFDEALGRLPAQYHVSQITASNDTLTISVTVGN